MTGHGTRPITARDTFTFDAPYSPAVLWGGLLLTFAHVLLVRYFLTDMDGWPVVSRVRAEFLSRPYPPTARCRVIVWTRPLATQAGWSASRLTWRMSSSSTVATVGEPAASKRGQRSTSAAVAARSSARASW